MALSIESMKTRIVQILKEEGAGAGASIHSFRCTWPPSTPPCDCLEQIAERIVEEVILAGPKAETESQENDHAQHSSR